MKATTLLLFLFFVAAAFAVPLDDYSRDMNEDPQDRRHHNRRKKPCQKDASGRTFFDWTYAPINIYNNYNSDCGGYGGGGLLGGNHHGGGLFGGNHHGGGLFGGNHHGGGPFGGNNHGGGQFGGNNHGGGLFGSHYQNQQNSGHNVGSNNGNNGGGLFGLGLFNLANWGLFNNNYRPNNRPKPESTEAPAVAEPANDTDDSNDYDDEKPVHEDHDDVVLDRHQNGNVGGYIQDITNFNPTRVVKRVNKEFNNFFKPLYDLFRK